MSALSLQILEPVNGTGLMSGAPILFKGSPAGDLTGLFFKWFSSLNPAATEDHPELNTADHSAAILNWSAPLTGFGSHVIVLAATDQDGPDLPSVKAVTRSALTGGAPPAASAPCVVHQVNGAAILTPATDGQTLSKAGATIEFLAPGAWVKPDPDHPGGWIANRDYQSLNGVALRLGFAPAGPVDPAPTAELALDLPGLPFIHDINTGKTRLRWTGALPSNLGTGNHVLSLVASAALASVTQTRQIVLTP